MVLDSDGRLFRVARAEPVRGQENPVWSMGTTRRLYFVKLAERPRPSWSAVQELVLQQVRSATSVWEGNPGAIARVQALRGISDLMQASRESWKWSQ